MSNYEVKIQRQYPSTGLLLKCPVARNSIWVSHADRRNPVTGASSPAPGSVLVGSWRKSWSKILNQSLLVWDTAFLTEAELQ